MDTVLAITSVQTRLHVSHLNKFSESPFQVIFVTDICPNFQGRSCLHCRRKQLLNQTAFGANPTTSSNKSLISFHQLMFSSPHGLQPRTSGGRKVVYLPVTGLSQCLSVCLTECLLLETQKESPSDSETHSKGPDSSQCVD